MTALSKEYEKSFPNPLDMIEQIASSHDWLFERSSDQDIAVEVTGHWCDYRMFVSWHADVHALLFACAFDMRVPSSSPLIHEVGSKQSATRRSKICSSSSNFMRAHLARKASSHCNSRATQS